MSSSLRFFALFAALWIAAMTWKVYPQFKDTLRIDGRVVALDDYIEDTCAERVGPLATTCRAAAIDQGRRLVTREQAKALLLVEAPLVPYAALYLLTRLRRRAGARRTAGG